jgi:hypothetical protein
MAKTITFPCGVSTASSAAMICCICSAQAMAARPFATGLAAWANQHVMASPLKLITLPP